MTFYPHISLKRHYTALFHNDDFCPWHSTIILPLYCPAWRFAMSFYRVISPCRLTRTFPHFIPPWQSAMTLYNAIPPWHYIMTLTRHSTMTFHHDILLSYSTCTTFHKVISPLLSTMTCSIHLYTTFHIHMLNKDTCSINYKKRILLWRIFFLVCCYL